jgi:uracil-DNA glycosylase
MSTIVAGEGPENAEIMLIGQNPGREEAEQGRPFVGKSGKYLDMVLRKNKLDRSKLYITSVVKETTPRNRKPTAQEIRYWMPCLLEEIGQVKPRIIVLMCSVAWETPRLEAVDYIETYHPAAAMRFPGAREKFENDFETLGKRAVQLQRPKGRLQITPTLDIQIDDIKQTQSTEYHRNRYCGQQQVKYIRNRPEPPFPHETDDLVTQQEEHPGDKQVQHERN